MLQVAYIGNGKSTNRYHLPFSSRLPEIVRVKTIYSRSGKSDWAPLEGVYYTSEIEDIYNDSEINLVVITTPSHSHYALAKQTLEAGKNVLVEKPFAETYAQAKELFDLAKSKNLFIQAYQNRRYDSDFLTTQKVIESGVLGDLIDVEIHYDRPESSEGSSYSLIDSYTYGLGSHSLDQAISYFGMPDDIHYDTRQLLGEGHMNDYFDFDLNYGNLKVAVSGSLMRFKARPSFVVYGQKGVFVKQTKDRQEEFLKLFYMPDNPGFGVDAEEHYGILTYKDDNGKFHKELVVSEVGDYRQVYRDIYETIINGKEKVVKDEETLLVMQIMEDGQVDLN
ncbi:MAG: NAD(P)-dependent oxidoreductase [Aerococcus viridans]|nr:MAG: NAD(P)-dependent oxidoreductase [Aerococcus viridans]